MDSRRQQKVASLVKEEFSDILLRSGRDIYGKAFVTVTAVKMTPDLSVARFYLSVFTGDKEEVLQQFQNRKPEVKRLLADKLRKHLRHIPDIEFFIDDTLDHVFKMEEIFKKIKAGDDELKEGS